jgi:hypothetical protein
MSIKYNGGYIPAVGADGTTLVANSASATGVAWAGPSVAAGKNAAINGGFDIWQRGTSFSLIATGSFIYGADRWWEYSNAGTCTVSQETSIVPTGFRYAKKIAQSGSTNTAYTFGQALETFNSLQYAGQTVVLSAYLAASASTTFSGWVSYSTSIDNASTGSWTALSPTGTANYTISSTTYNRFSWVFNVPSNAKSLMINLQSSNLAAGTNAYVAGVQLEAGSVATPFTTATGTMQGELAACQRYFINFTGLASTPSMGAASTTVVYRVPFPLPVTMRTTPSANYSGTPQLYDGVTLTNISGLGSVYLSNNLCSVDISTASSLTQYRPYLLYFNNGTINLSAEL